MIEKSETFKDLSLENPAPQYMIERYIYDIDDRYDTQYILYNVSATQESFQIFVKFINEDYFPDAVSMVDCAELLFISKRYKVQSLLTTVMNHVASRITLCESSCVIGMFNDYLSKTSEKASYL